MGGEFAQESSDLGESIEKPVEQAPKATRFVCPASDSRGRHGVETSRCERLCYVPQETSTRKKNKVEAGPEDMGRLANAEHEALRLTVRRAPAIHRRKALPHCRFVPERNSPQPTDVAGSSTSRFPATRPRSSLLSGRDPCAIYPGRLLWDRAGLPVGSLTRPAERYLRSPAARDPILIVVSSSAVF